MVISNSECISACLKQQKVWSENFVLAEVEEVKKEETVVHEEDWGISVVEVKLGRPYLNTKQPHFKFH